VRRLIVNADDFGLTGGVNLAITELQRCGALTSTTLMARAAATPDALELARATPTLGVGCHVVLVDGEPMLLPSQQIPNLADLRSGLFRPKLGKFLLWLAQDAVWSRHSPAEIEAEASAQIASLPQCCGQSCAQPMRLGSAPFAIPLSQPGACGLLQALPGCDGLKWHCCVCWSPTFAELLPKRG